MFRKKGKHSVKIILNNKEKTVLEELCKEKDLSEENLMRLALHVFQLVDLYAKKGIHIPPKSVPKVWLGEE